MKRAIIIASILAAAVWTSGCGPNTQEKKLTEFIKAHLEKVIPLSKESNLAYWSAATTGKAEDYDKYSELELKLRQIHSSSDDFALLKQLKESGKIKNPELARQLEILYNSYLENQIEPDLLKKIVELGTEVEKKFSTFRGTIDNKKNTSNEIDEILKKETDSHKRQQAWFASKQVGPEVAMDIIQLVKLRNEAARKLGFANYHALSLTTSEQSAEELDQIFSELEKLTNEPFAKLKTELDKILADKYKVSVNELMPWHYHDPFFQETPLVYELDLDVYYQGKDVKDLATKFYSGIGLPAETILQNSDLYEREGKNPHAFCTDIDREGDVRILCNLKNNERWMETTLHELGHAVYDKNHDPAVPYLLRMPAHTFTTEAIAMFFGRLSRNAAWMQQMLGLTTEEREKLETTSRKYAQLKQLIFARWAMVMYGFEKELYNNPDQDLNSLWWQMVSKYQYINQPLDRNEPDWAAKIHFTIAPCYYHNYLLGELLASQLHHYLVHTILGQTSDLNISYAEQPLVGNFLQAQVFRPGALYRWNDMITKATGESLTAKYFVQQFVQ
jgi:peptidyl-dipeptidase A